MKNKVMLIGAIDAGKTTLINRLLGKEVKALKTQSLLYYDWIVDTPGEYTENPMFYQSIMATALEVTHVCYIQDASRKKNIFPPGFSRGITKLPIALVTKCDHEDADLERATESLNKVVYKGPLLYTSSFTGSGLNHLKKLVACKTMEEMLAYVTAENDDNLIFIA